MDKVVKIIMQRRAMIEFTLLFFAHTSELLLSPCQL